MGFYVSPGVYPKTRDISEIIPNLATTTAGIVGYSAKGNVASIRLISTQAQFIEEYGKPDISKGHYFHHSALAFLEKGNALYCFRVHKSALHGGVSIAEDAVGSNATLSTGKTVAQVDDDATLFTSSAPMLYIFGKDPGVWNNTLKVKVLTTDKFYTDRDPSENYLFDIVVYEVVDGVDVEVESWTVSRQEKLDGYGKQLYLESKINVYSKYIIVRDNPLIPDIDKPKEQTTALVLGGGTDGTTGAQSLFDSEVVAGWDKYLSPESIDVRVLIGGGYTNLAVQNKILAVAEARRDCIAVFDIPSSEITVTDMVDWRKTTQNVNSSYSALYTPWVKVYDPYSDSIVEVPPSGYVASQFAYNDYVSEAWYAPAGFNRGTLNVLGLTQIFTQGERDTLYQNQINALQAFRGEGNIIWGQKTQQRKASALDRVNVRRLLIILEKAISAALRPFVFEPNNDITRFRISSMIDTYMNSLSARGAFQTSQEDKGYRVLVDESNNTPAVIDANELHVDVFIKPIRSAEYIQLQSIITRTGVSFEELIARGIMF